MQVTELIGHPELLSRDTLPELRRIVGQCPYYHAARLLLVENLFMLHEQDFDNELRTAALYLPDRSVLFDLVESLNYQLDNIQSKEEKPAMEPIPSSGDRTYDLLEQFFSEMAASGYPASSQDTSPVGDYMAIIEQMEDAQETADNDSLAWGLDGNGDAHQTPSVNETAEEEKESVALEDETESIGEGFDAQNVEESPYAATGASENASSPRFDDSLAPKNDDVETEDEENDPLEENHNEASERIGDEYFTETLAKVFIKQGNYERAIEILTKINLVNPRKNAYFADQIRFLQKLVVNNKHKK